MIDDSERLAGQIAELVVQIYEIHEIIIQQTGGLPGLRDGAMLHSAVAHPFTTFASEELYPSDFEKAAALFHSLIKSHPLWMAPNGQPSHLCSIFWKTVVTTFL